MCYFSIYLLYRLIYFKDMIVQHILGKILQMKRDHFSLTERMWFAKSLGRQKRA